MNGGCPCPDCAGPGECPACTVARETYTGRERHNFNEHGFVVGLGPGDRAVVGGVQLVGIGPEPGPPWFELLCLVLALAFVVVLSIRVAVRL